VETQLVTTRRTLKSYSVALGKVGLSFFGEESAARRTVEELDTALAAEIVGHVEGFRTVVGALSDAVAAETGPALSLLAYDAVSDRMAFPHEHYEGAAHDRAKGHCEPARTLAGDSQRDALEKACGSLRTAYEDFIQKRLFNNVVRRWRENITFTLDQVYFDEVIAGRIHDRMATLSRYIDAHSHSEDFHEVPLSTDLVKSELTHFDAIKSDYKKARAEWEKARPKTVNIFS
jgi:hypothetical protein